MNEVKKRAEKPLKTLVKQGFFLILIHIEITRFLFLGFKTSKTLDITRVLSNKKALEMVESFCYNLGVK